MSIICHNIITIARDGTINKFIVIGILFYQIPTEIGLSQKVAALRSKPYFSTAFSKYSVKISLLTKDYRLPFEDAHIPNNT
jgi:hypothetical protein